MFLLESAQLQFWKILIIGNLWKSLDYKFQIEKKKMSLLKSDTQKNEFKFVSLAINPMSHRTYYNGDVTLTEIENCVCKVMNVFFFFGRLMDLENKV